MSPTPKLNELRKAVQLTEQMYQHAQSKQWEELSELQQQREPLIQQIFPLDSYSAEAHQLLERMIMLNQQAESYCKEARQLLHMEMNGLNTNKKAVKAYQSS